jgi:prepilin-type N-terminal cleavage/methylation domain-containing protein
MKNKKLLNDKNGFTLVEMMVVLAILSIVIGAIYGVFAAVNRSCTNNEVSAEVMQHLRTSIDFMEQDIRMAGLDRFDSADAGIDPFAKPADTYLRFTADRNMNGAINMTDFEDITYEYDGVNRRLRQCLYEGKPEEDCDTVAENVTVFQFAYFDEDDNILAAPIDRSLISTVQVTMTIEQPAGPAGTVSRTLTKRILCRNLSF